MEESEMPKVVEYWMINDPIYGLIKFPKKYEDGQYSTIYKIINHPHFQRLRRIKQLSFVSMVYPGANHTRFEHSIGVAWLVKLAMEHLLKVDYSLNDGSEDISYHKKVINSMICTALLHDIGQGPLSHVFEEFWFNGELDHESIAEKIITNDVEFKYAEYTSINKILQSGEDYDLIDDVTGPMVKLIRGKGYHPMLPDNDHLSIGNGIPEIISKYEYNYFLLIKDRKNVVEKYDVNTYENAKELFLKNPHILAYYHNLINSNLDCDKMDYLIRDNYYCGKPIHIDYKYIIENIEFCPIPEYCNTHLIVYNKKSLHSIETLLNTRLFHYPQIALNRTNQAIEALTVEIMKGIYELCKNESFRSKLIEKNTSFELLVGSITSYIDDSPIRILSDNYLNMDDSSVISCFYDIAYGNWQNEKLDEQIENTRKLCRYFFRRYLPRQLNKYALYSKETDRKNSTDRIEHKYREARWEALKERRNEVIEKVNNVLDGEGDSISVIAHQTKEICEYSSIDDEPTYKNTLDGIIKDKNDTNAIVTTSELEEKEKLLSKYRKLIFIKDHSITDAEKAIKEITKIDNCTYLKASDKDKKAEVKYYIIRKPLEGQDEFDVSHEFKQTLQKNNLL